MDTDKRADLRAAVGHFLALDDAEEARIEGQVGPPAFESEWVKAREAMRAALATPATEPGLDGSALIAAERRRQIEVERYDASHDAGHADSLARAGAAYALPEASRHYLPDDKRFAFDPPFEWPWDAEWWKPTPQDRVRELVKAGALIAAAIDSILSRAPASEEERR